MAEIINLGDYLTAGTKVVSGREQGQEIRRQSHIDNLLETSGKVIIQLPEQIRSLSPSFLEAFLGEAIRNYRRDGFLERVEFTKAERYDVTDDLEEAIDRVLTEQNALAY